MEATIKTLATKDDLVVLRKDMETDFTNLGKQIGESKAYNIKWMFIFWIGQIAATAAIVFLLLKK